MRTALKGIKKKGARKEMGILGGRLRGPCGPCWKVATKDLTWRLRYQKKSLRDKEDRKEGNLLTLSAMA